jgi:hypothetical protein
MASSVPISNLLTFQCDVTPELLVLIFGLQGESVDASPVNHHLWKRWVRMDCNALCFWGALDESNRALLEQYCKKQTSCCKRLFQ